METSESMTEEKSLTLLVNNKDTNRDERNERKLWKERAGSQMSESEAQVRTG